MEYWVEDLLDWALILILCVLVSVVSLDYGEKDAKASISQKCKNFGQFKVKSEIFLCEEKKHG